MPLPASMSASILSLMQDFKERGWSRLDLAYTRQDLFPEEFERAQDALRIVSGSTLKGEVDHASAHFITALLDLLHDCIRTADEIRWQGAITKGWPGNPGDVTGIQLREGVADGRPHGERRLRMLLPQLQRLLGFRVAVGQEHVTTVDNLLRRRFPTIQSALLPIVVRRLAHGLEGSKGHAEAEAIARRELTRFA